MGDEIEHEKELIWNMVHIMIEIECGQPKLYGSKAWEEKEGNDLNQFDAHRFFEKNNETLTVKELTSILKKIDIDNNNRMCLTEYLIYKYNKSGDAVVNSPQGGGDPNQLLAAKKQYDEAVHALQLSTQAKEEANESVKSLEAEEKKYNDKLKKFEEKINDKKLSQMKINRAKSELAQLKCEDPMPLRKAKLTSKAALKKSKKAKKLAQKELESAKEIFDQLKKGGGAAFGAIWWMERTLEETNKYAPSKGKKKKQKQKKTEEKN